MSGAQTSTAPNVLFDPLMAGRQQAQTNQLAGQQLDLSNANMDQVARASAGLLSAYTDEPSRAAAYPRVVGMLQSQGFAKNAPAQYPGEAVLRSLVNQSIPAKDLYSSGALMTPAQQQLLNSTGTTPSATSTTGTAPPASGSVATAPSGTIEPAAFNNATAVRDGLIKRGIDADTATALAANALHESVANPRTGRGDNGNSAGLFQWAGPRLQSYTDAYGHSPDGSPLDEQLDNVVRELKGSEAAAAAKIAEAQGPAAKAAAVSQYYLRPKDTVPEMQRRSATALQLQQQIGGGTTTASAAPATAPAGGVAARTGGTDTAGPAAGSTPPTAAPAGPPAAQQPLPQDQAVAQAKATGQAVPVAGTQALWALPSGNITGSPPPAATPPAPATAPAQPPAAAPASTSRLPEASTIPTGQNSAPYRQAMQLQQQAMQYDAVAGTNPAFAKRAADLRLQAAGILQAGATVSAQQNGREGELEVVTGKFTPYAPLPSPRFTGGAAVYNKATGGWDQPTPATQADAVQGHWGVSGSGQPQFFPDATVPAEGGYKNMETAYKRDSENITSIGAEGRTAQADQVRVQEMRNILKTVNTGSGAETQAAIQAFLQSWAPSALTNWTTNYANLDGPSAIQMFQKLGFMGATSQEQQTTPRGGYLATKLFQQFNPGAHLLTATNNGLLAQRLISNQASIDYTQGAQDHFGEQEQNFTSSKPSYASLNQFDRQWQAQRNPQVYAAAIGALGQQDYNQWSKNLSEAEIQRTLDVVHRADPGAVVNGKGGRLDLSQQGAAGAQQPQAQTSTQQPAAAAPARIIHYDANGKRM